MWHLAVFNNSAVGVNVVDFDLAAVTDQAITVSNGHYIFMVPVQVIGAYALGASVLRAKIQTPKTRQIANPYIRPVERQATPPNRPLFDWMGDSPIALNPIDETQILISNNLGAATERETVGIWVSDGDTSVPTGSVFTIRATSVVTGVTDAWTAGVMTFDQVLPAGRYAVVGMNAIGTNLLFARLIFPLQVWRPGCIGQLNNGTFAGDYFNRGRLPKFGEFESVAQPQVEVFGAGAVSNPEIYLDVIRIR